MIGEGSGLARRDAQPAGFASVETLEDFMTQPTPALISDLSRAPGDVIVLGVAGKMGPTLARLARRAAPERRVVGVARFSDPAARAALEAVGVETIQADLLDADAVARLPKLPNVVFMAGRKFGSSGDETLTWAMNAYVPAVVAQAFARSRIVCFSTGCVYPFVPVTSGGADEDVAPDPPPGEYANSCLARERLFQHFSAALGTSGRILRLNYAIDLRYGVLHDVARKVLAGEPVDLAMGHVNVIWQGDANAVALRCLARCTTPSAPLNLTGPETVSVRWLARIFGRLFDREPNLVGTEAASGWLNNAGRMCAEFGYPRVPLARMIEWTADWVARGGATLDKPTHYEVRDGRY